MVPMKRTFADWVWMAVALPASIWAVAMVVWLGGVVVGVPGAFDSRTMTLTEASAVASYADAYRLLEHDADPNAPARLRAGLVRNRADSMTPLEAATGAIRTGPVQMLIDHGAVIDSRTFPVLWCGAVSRRNQDIQRLLEAYRPPGQPSIDCASVRALW